jgi:hypothetical protein
VLTWPTKIRGLLMEYGLVLPQHINQAYCTARVTVAMCVSDPDVAETVTV